MRVDELRAILEHLPDDAEVVIPADVKLAHVRVVKRKRKNETPTYRWHNEQRDPAAIPAHVELRASGYPVHREPAVGWWLSPPPIQLRGPFRRAAELERRLDAFGIGGPEHDRAQPNTPNG